MKNKNRIFIIVVLLILIVLQLSAISDFYAPFLFYGIIAFYFLLGIINDNLTDKIFIFLIATLSFFGISLRDDVNSVSISMFLHYRILFFLPSFLAGLLVQKLSNPLKISLLYGVSPLLLQSLLVSFLSINPYITLFSLYIVVSFLYFFKVKILTNNNLFFFLVPLFLYFIVGLFVLKTPGTKEISIFLSLLLIIVLPYIFIKKFRRKQIQ